MHQNPSIPNIETHCNSVTETIILHHIYRSDDDKDSDDSDSSEYSELEEDSAAEDEEEEEDDDDDDDDDDKDSGDDDDVVAEKPSLPDSDNKKPKIKRASAIENLQEATTAKSDGEAPSSKPDEYEYDSSDEEDVR